MAEVSHRIGTRGGRFTAGDLQVEHVVLFPRGLMIDFELRIFP
jgi:hypothetical protein